jgi:hypothetical protein
MRLLLKSWKGINVIHAGFTALRSEFHKLISSNWNMEQLPDQWNKSISDSMEYSPIWEADSHSAIQENSPPLWNSKVHHRAHTVFQVHFSHQTFQPKFCAYFSSPPCVLHAPIISSSLCATVSSPLSLQPPIFKHSPKHPVLIHPQSVVCPVRDLVWHPHKRTSKML